MPAGKWLVWKRTHNLLTRRIVKKKQGVFISEVVDTPSTRRLTLCLPNVPTSHAYQNIWCALRAWRVKNSGQPCVSYMPYVSYISYMPYMLYVLNIWHSLLTLAIHAKKIGALTYSTCYLWQTKFMFHASQTTNSSNKK